MGFFTGPSDEYLEKMSIGINSNMFQLILIEDLISHDRQEIEREMARRGLATSVKSLTDDVVQIIKDHNMGMWKRGRFLAKIQGGLLAGGLETAKANEFVTEINNRTR